MYRNRRAFFAAIVSALLFFAVSAFGAPVGFETAESVARQHLERKRGGGSVKIRRGFAHKAKPLFKPYYVFEKESGGFVIVSADDVAVPILGEADGGVFDRDGMPPALVWLLGVYERQIEEAVKGGEARDVETAARWKRLTQSPDAALRRSSAPEEARYPLRLLSTTWDQGEPYNLKAPFDENVRSKAGCVATAMSQIMKYWRHPASGKGASAPYYTVTKEISVPSVQFNVSYDYGDMLDNYQNAGSGTAAQRDAVSTLMYHSGVSVNMDYGHTESNAYSWKTASALTEYFDYDNSIQDIYSDDISASEWKDIVIGQIENNSPVYYSGHEIIGDGYNGHAFVIDGYDGDADRFHINWGWGGSCDGFFALTALNPGAHLYNAQQMMIINIMPNTNGNPPSQINVTGLDVSITSFTLNARIGAKINYGADFNGKVGLAVMSGGAVEQVLVFADYSFHITHNENLFLYRRLGADTPTGDVALQVVTKRGNGEWTPVGEARSISIPPAADLKEEWDCGEIPGTVTASLYGDGAFVIEGFGRMADYGFMDYGHTPATPWRDFISYITAAVIGEGVTNIGENTFFGCANLTSAAIGNSVDEIGYGAFSGCVGIESVAIPNSVGFIDSRAFYGCAGLKSVAIPNGVASIEIETFSECTGLTSVIIPNSVKAIRTRAFSGCAGLASIIIPNSVKIIRSSAFLGCAGLKSVAIPNGVDSIENDVFYNCAGLTSVAIPNSVGSIGNNAFYGCARLKSVIIPNGVKTIGEYAFNGCAALTSVIIPESVKSIGNYAFARCANLTSIISLNPIPPQIYQNYDFYPGSAFYGLDASSVCLYVPQGSIDSYASAEWWNVFGCINPVSTVDVTFNYLDGGEPSAQTAVRGGKAIKPPDPVRNGYAFGGWYTDAACTGGAWDFDIDAVTADTTLYACLTPTIYTITYVLDGGTAASANPANYTVETADFTLNNPTKIDCAFAGWTGTNGATPQTNVSVDKGSVGDRHYVANWTFIGTIAVLNPDRVFPAAGSGGEAGTVVEQSQNMASPVTALTAEFVAGPNPAGKSLGGAIRFFRRGGRVANAALSIYDASGNVVNKVVINDNGTSAKTGKRLVGAWDLRDKKGCAVSDGAYLVKGALVGKDGVKDRVSVLVSVVR